MFGDCHDPVAFQTIQTGHTSTLPLPDTDLNIQVPPISIGNQLCIIEKLKTEWFSVPLIV